MLATNQSRSPFPVPEPSNYSREVIERAAGAVAEAIALKPGGDLHGLVTSRLGGVIELLTMDKWRLAPESLIVRGLNDFLIRVEAIAPTERARFNIAHELGHYFLHSEQGKKQIAAQRYEDLNDLANSEANWFAAELLMPRKLFLQLAGKGLSFPQLASFFCVSQTAAETRHRYLT